MFYPMPVETKAQIPGGRVLLPMLTADRAATKNVVASRYDTSKQGKQDRKAMQL